MLDARRLARASERREGVCYTTVPWGAGESSCGIWIMQGSVTEN